MAVINGKWKLVSDENVEAFIKATGGGDEAVNGYLESRKQTETIETFAVRGECVKATTSTAGKSTTVNLYMGKWCDLPDDAGASKILIQDLENGQYAFAIDNANYKATGTRVVTGDDMVLAITVSGAGVTGIRRFKRVK